MADQQEQRKPIEFPGGYLVGMGVNALADRILREVAVKFTDHEIINMTISGEVTRNFLFFKAQEEMDHCADEIHARMCEHRRTHGMYFTRHEDQAYDKEKVKEYQFGFYVIC